MLDEITYAYQWELLNREHFIHILKGTKEPVEIVITGRNPSSEMIQLADYISNIGCEKHPYQRGISARRGIEF